MSKKKTSATDATGALATAAARADRPKQQRVATAKHSKAKSIAVVNPALTAAPVEPQMSELEEISLVAYLYSEARGFQGGSPAEDWLRAEQEVRNRRG